MFVFYTPDPLDATCGPVTYTVYGDRPPPPEAGACIEVPDQAFPTLSGLTVAAGQLVYADLTEFRALAIAEVNGIAGTIRKTFITDEPGQEMLYLEKKAEAVAWLAQPSPPATLEDYPLMAREIGPGLTAASAGELAQIWVNMAHMWKIAGGQIEEARLGAIYAIELAPDPASIEAVLASYRGVMGA